MKRIAFVIPECYWLWHDKLGFSDSILIKSFSNEFASSVQRRATRIIGGSGKLIWIKSTQPATWKKRKINLGSHASSYRLPPWKLRYKYWNDLQDETTQWPPYSSQEKRKFVRVVSTPGAFLLSSHKANKKVRSDRSEHLFPELQQQAASSERCTLFIFCILKKVLLGRRKICSGVFGACLAHSGLFL